MLIASGLKPGWVIWVTRVMFCPCQAIKYLGFCIGSRVLLMEYSADQSNDLSMLDGQDESVRISSRLTVQLEYFDLMYLENSP